MFRACGVEEKNAVHCTKQVICMVFEFCHAILTFVVEVDTIWACDSVCVCVWEMLKLPFFC